MSTRGKSSVRKTKHQDHRLVGILKKHLKGVKLKENKDFRIIPQIGGGKNRIIIHIDAKHRDQHKEKLERAAHSEGIPLEFRALAA